jgi:hypothetical protein
MSIGAHRAGGFEVALKDLPCSGGVLNFAGISNITYPVVVGRAHDGALRIKIQLAMGYAPYLKPKGRRLSCLRIF